MSWRGLMRHCAVTPTSGYTLGYLLRRREVGVLRGNWRRTGEDDSCAALRLDSPFFYALHRLKRTQEAYDQLKPALDQFSEVELPWYNLACYACVLGNKEEAKELLDKAIELGGDDVKLRALKDEDLLGVWGGGDG